MMVYSSEIKKLAWEYRNGKKCSYNKISDVLGIPKSTLSFWFSNSKKSQSVKIHNTEKLYRLNKIKMLRLNKKWVSKTRKRHIKFRNEAIQEYKTLRENKLFLVGLSLYWGEGKKRVKGVVGLINTDPGILKIIKKFYRECLNIPNNKLKIELFIYNDIDKNEAITYWSELLKININQFRKTQILPSRSNITKMKLRYGICNIYFCSVEYNIKIMQWIKLLSNEKRW